MNEPLEESAPPRVTVYIDGFNLYHGLKEHTKARAYRWLNLWALSESLLLPGHRLERVLYFTSLPPWSKGKIARHQAYIDALKSVGVEVVLGRFQDDVAMCYGTCQQPFKVFTEKLTDVNISTSILRDAVLNRFDWAYLVTGDADQVPTIQTLKEVTPEKQVYVIFPPRRLSWDLQQSAEHCMDGPLNHRKIKPHVFPDVVKTATGIVRIPERWKPGWTPDGTE